MEIIRIIGLGLVTTILVVLLKQEKPEIALQLSIVVGVIIFWMLLDKISFVINMLQDLSQRANVEKIYISTIFKIVGIAYLAEFGAQICNDAGSSSIASKIEFAAQIIIMVISLPIFMAVIDLVFKILP